MPNAENFSPRLFIPSVETASQMIRNAYRNADFDQLSRIQNLLKSQDLVKSLSGTSDGFHNAAVRLTQDGMYAYAYDLIKIGIMRNPHNTDLLSDALMYGSRCNAGVEELKGWYDQLMQVNKRFWTWRAYQFAFDYLMDLLPYKSGEDLKGIESEIETLIKDFKGHFTFLHDQSDCEKVYMMEYEFYISKGELESAENALQEATESLKNKCAQCAMHYADHLFERGKYREVIGYAKQAVTIKEDQPSISKGYTYYILAMSQEWIARTDNTLTQSDTLKDIYTSYFCAYLYMEPGRDHLMEAIKNQVRVLEYETKISSEIPFKQMDNAKTNNSMDMLRRILDHEESQSE